MRVRFGEWCKKAVEVRLDRNIVSSEVRWYHRSHKTEFSERMEAKGSWSHSCYTNKGIPYLSRVLRKRHKWYNWLTVGQWPWDWRSLMELGHSSQDESEHELTMDDGCWQLTWFAFMCLTAFRIKRLWIYFSFKDVSQHKARIHAFVAKVKFEVSFCSSRAQLILIHLKWSSFGKLKNSL